MARRVGRIYKTLFGKKLPYQIQFRVLGYCDHFARVILLGSQDIDGKEDFNTLIHELVHVRYPNSSHGKRFEKQVDKLVKLARKVK